MDPTATPIPASDAIPTPQTAIASLEGLINGFLARLPYVVLAFIVMVVFYIIARGVRSVVRRLAERTHRHQNLGLVMGRLAQFTIILLGLLVAPGDCSARLHSWASDRVTWPFQRRHRVCLPRTFCRTSWPGF